MSTSAQPPKRRNNLISSLDVAIEVLNIAKEALNLTPANAVVCSVSALLVMIRVYSVLFCPAKFLIRACLGYDGQRGGLRRSRVDLC